MEEFNGIKIEESNEPLNQPSTTKTPGLFGLIFEKMTSDMKFVGLFTIIYGAITCLSIIGALIGVPLIIAGLRLREAADEYKMFQISNDKNSLRIAFEKQSKYFNILKILIIVSLVLLVLYIIGIILFGALFFSSMPSYDYQQY